MYERSLIGSPAPEPRLGPAAVFLAGLVLMVPMLSTVTAVGAAAAEPPASGDETAPEPTGDQEPEVFGESIDVVGEWQPVSGVEILSREDLPTMPAGDGADLLRGIAGVSIGRMGGHGLEPVIRGLGESNLNVLIDGAYIHGGCPNRMDPSTSFAATGGVDRVVVLKGMQSLRHGAGGSAGTVLFERQAPVPVEERPWSARAETGYSSWSERPELQLNANYAGKSFYVRADAESRKLDSYKDGSGDVVRSAFESRNANLMVGMGDRERAFLELGYERSRTEDALFAGAGMDSPNDRGDTFRMKLRRPAALGSWDDFSVDFYSSLVDHLMDNYSLRPLVAPSALRVPATSDTYGGRASARLTAGQATRLTLGLDYQNNQREALRFAGPNPQQVTLLQSVMWPQAEVAQGGLFLESEHALVRGSRLRFGARVDSFEASAGKADLQPVGMNPSPNQLYLLYYGRRAEDWSRSGFSALARYERPFAGEWTFFSGLSRSLRAADATERYLGAGSPAPAKRWIGNPNLDLSIHHQVDLGFATTADRYTGSATAFVDEVDDFILRDRARAQPGILLDDRASVYRNVDARLVGLELEGSWQASAGLGLRGNASWVRGENRTDSRPLAQIPPLHGLAALDYGAGRWRGTAAVHWATEQTRVDDDPLTGSGLDYGPTPGYATLELEGSFAWRGGIEILAGLENLLDKTYAQHLNRGNLFDPDPVRVNEPGRSAWLRLRWSNG